MFNVREGLFCNPEDIWMYFTDLYDAREVQYLWKFNLYF